MKPSFFDALEHRPAAERETALLAALPLQIANAQQNSRAFAAVLSGVYAAQVNTRAALVNVLMLEPGESLTSKRVIDEIGPAVMTGVLFLVSVLTFSFTSLLPSDPVDLIIGDHDI